MITCKPFQLLDGKQTYIYTLHGDITVEVATCGATVTSLKAPDKNGNMVDVVLGLLNAQEIVNTPSYMGSVVGRCANRIRNGQITVEGKIFQLACNSGSAHLHGGNVGFNKKVFEARTEGDTLYLSVTSADGEENYPGNLQLEVAYAVEGKSLTITYTAKCDDTTVFNPTNHCYFNLNGESDGDISDNYLQIFAKKFLPLADDFVPSGEERCVAGTPFDFSIAKPIGRDIAAEDDQLKLAGGFDHNFCLDGRCAAFAFSNKTGITLRCTTDMPGVQLYTGNFLTGEQGKSKYPPRSGFCLETQFFPNAVNCPQWKSPILKKGEVFKSTTEYTFGLKQDTQD